ncbi:hypothetical protein HanRHA438_Chr15g0725791 [Helianthus annuus]|nr:hypothetical protein HanRHA438_Chr15g0725791 [Helianthus annuus]
MEKQLPSQVFTPCMVGMSFPNSRMSSTYSTKKVMMLPLAFLYTQASSSFLMNPKFLISSSKR